jgi:hypothetical protein
MLTRSAWRSPERGRYRSRHSRPLVSLPMSSNGGSAVPVVCPSCQGTGFTKRTNRLLRLLGLPWKLCDLCVGTGMVQPKDANEFRQSIR